MPYLIGGGFIVLLVGIYVLSYVVNSKTKVPEGCELPEDFAGCSGCSQSGCMSRVEINKRLQK